jgi:DNA-binding GntR family transcriptional regulator
MSTDPITDTLRHEILSGLLAPGALLGQVDLAQRFGTSRIPIRDTLQRLAAERLVQIVPNRGARVIRLAASELAEVYALRILLECDCLTQAIQNATAEAMSEVEHALQLSNLQAGRVGWQAGDWVFHQALYAAANRPRQIALICELRQTCALHLAHYDQLTTQTARWLADHLDLVTAYRAKDVAAATLILTRHITTARDHLLKQVP